MARIAGVDLPVQKRLWVGLTSIYGIGQERAKKLAAKANVDHTKKIRDLTEDEINHLRQAIEQEGRVEGDLRKEIQMNIRRLIEIQAYRGIRHRRNLPCAASERTPTRAPAKVRGAAPWRRRRRFWARRASDFLEFRSLLPLFLRLKFSSISRNGVNRGKRAAKECSAGRGSSTGKTGGGSEAQKRIQEEARAPRYSTRRGVRRGVVQQYADFHHGHG